MDSRSFFNKVAFQWDRMCYHDEDKIRKIIALAQIQEKSKILDVGTGTGILIGYLLEKDPVRITAIDVAENMIAVAQSKYQQKEVEFIAQDIMSYDGDTFHYIFLYSCYPHFREKEKLFAHLASLLKNQGKIVIAHSQSKEEINRVHGGNDTVKDDLLPPVEITAQMMEKFFEVETTIDSEEMYYICARAKNI